MPDLATEGGYGSPMVLVADDNEVAPRLCRRVLEKAGYAVLIAADGIQAVDIALAQNPNVILMDVAMPGMDGLEAMRQIKAARPEMRIVIASAHSMASDFVSEATPALLAQYAATSNNARNEPIDAILIMRP